MATNVVANNTSFTVQSTCGPGKIVTGGGFSSNVNVNTANSGWTTTANRPVSFVGGEQGWVVSGVNQTGMIVNVSVYMICIAVQ